MMFKNLFLVAFLSLLMGIPIKAEEEEGLDLEQLLRQGTLPEKKYTSQQIFDTCKKYGSQYISYYEKIYWVDKDCKKTEIKDPAKLKTVTTIKKITEVDAETMGMISDKITVSPETSKTLCRDLNQKYLFSPDQEFYFMEGCKLRKIPNWQTKLRHSQKKGLLDSEIVVLPPEVFYSLETGKEIADVVKDDQGAGLSFDPIVLLPLEEACKGLKGKYIAYYDQVALVDATCRKKILSSDKLFEFQLESYRKGKDPTQFTRVSSSIWLSLPEANP